MPHFAKQIFDAARIFTERQNIDNACYHIMSEQLMMSELLQIVKTFDDARAIIKC